mgnify:CR=1 FL=1
MIRDEAERLAREVAALGVEVAALTRRVRWWQVVVVLWYLALAALLFTGAVWGPFRW